MSTTCEKCNEQLKAAMEAYQYKQKALVEAMEEIILLRSHLAQRATAAEEVTLG